MANVDGGQPLAMIDSCLHTNPTDFPYLSGHNNSSQASQRVDKNITFSNVKMQE